MLRRRGRMPGEDAAAPSEEPPANASDDAEEGEGKTWLEVVGGYNPETNEWIPEKLVKIDNYITPTPELPWERSIKRENLVNYCAIEEPPMHPYPMKWITAKEILDEMVEKNRHGILVKGLEREIPVDIFEDLREPTGKSLYKYVSIVCARNPILLLHKGEKVEEDWNLNDFEHGALFNVMA